MIKFDNKEEVLKYLSAHDAFTFDEIDFFYFKDTRYKKFYTADAVFEWIFEANDRTFASIGLGLDRIPYFKIGTMQEVMSPEVVSEEEYENKVLKAMAQSCGKKMFLTAKNKKKRKISPPNPYN